MVFLCFVLLWFAFIFCILNVFLYFQSVMSPVPSFVICYCGVFATMPVRVLLEPWQWCVCCL